MGANDVEGRYLLVLNRVAINTHLNALGYVTRTVHLTSKGLPACVQLKDDTARTFTSLCTSPALCNALSASAMRWASLRAGSSSRCDTCIHTHSRAHARSKHC
jgi:hypothetical protein